jgi:cytochrome c556
MAACGDAAGDSCNVQSAVFRQYRGDHMIRTLLAIAIALGVTAAIAQEDPIKARKALMKANGQQAKIVGDMAKGDTPFDLAAAQKAFATFQDAASKMPGLYPDSSKGGDPADDFNAGPKVWEDMADFKARFVKFGEDAKAAADSVKDVDTLKAALGNIGKNDCGACHQIYRIKKS